MKKLLLSTTAIAAFGLVANAEASNLQVNVGGYLDFQAGHVSDDITGEAAATNINNETEFNTDAEIHFIVEGKADNGLEYGAVVELEADVAAGNDAYNSGNNADKAYLYLQGGWGRVEMGENTGAEEALAVNTSNFASATGGIDGDWYRYAAVPGTPAAFITKPKLALGHSGTGSLVAGQAADEDATKITYYTPRFAGFQAGVSYIPNTGDTGRFAAATIPAADNEDVVTAGINFTEQFDEVGVSAAVTGIVSGSDKTVGGTNDLEGYQAGLNVTLAGFTLGGSYGDYQDTQVGAATSEGDYYDVGLGYAMGPWSASATYFNSTVDLVGGTEDEFTNIALGVDYQLAPGLVPYAEVAIFEFDGAGTGIANDNEGTVVMLGTELSF